MRFFFFPRSLITDIFVGFLIPSKRLPESRLKTATRSFHRIHKWTLAVKTPLKYDEASENNKLAVGVYELIVART
jgi:hypothetical protein